MRFGRACDKGGCPSLGSQGRRLWSDKLLGQDTLRTSVHGRVKAAALGRGRNHVTATAKVSADPRELWGRDGTSEAL